MIEQAEQVPFASRNSEGYACLLYIEVALRELARHELCRHYGEKWQKRIPGRYLQKIRRDQKDEATKASLGFRRLGPLYYLTFGELVEVAIQEPTVEAVTRVLGQQGPALLMEIVPCRNAIAHCRDLSEEALATVRALSSRMTTGLAAHGLAGVLQQPDIGLYPEEARELIARWLTEVQDVLSELRALTVGQESYKEASRQYWWSSSDLAGFDVELVDGLAVKVRQYSQLPGGVGAAATRERFISESGILTDLEKITLMLGRAR